MITIQGLSKSYGGRSVLKGVDLSVRAGEFLVVLGPSGAGKSTMLRCVNGLVQPDGGRIMIDGSRVSLRGAGGASSAAPSAMIFQHHNLVRRLTVLKNVLVGRMAGLSSLLAVLQLFPSRDVEIAMQCLERVELGAQGDVARRPALRRRAAARRHRPRARAGAGRDPRRRAGREPRPEDLAHRARISQAHLQGDQHRGDLQPAPGRLRGRIRRADRGLAGRVGDVRRRAVGADLRRRPPHLSGARRSGIGRVLKPSAAAPAARTPRVAVAAA